jgi:uncharacterized protein (DUF924 family)
MRNSDVETSSSIHDFWFGREKDDLLVARNQSALWWSKNEAIDLEITQRFESTLLASASRELDAWSERPEGLLALILLVDQFPRNMYRGTPRSFAFDALARKWCQLGLSRGAFDGLRPIERVFCYLPLEHSESLEDQLQSVHFYQLLRDDVPAEQREPFEFNLEFAKKHYEIVKRFGRFPHRNEILQRPSTQEEIAFLQQPGSSF